MDDRIAQCLWLLIRRAQSGDTCAGAFLADYARLLCKAGEPLPEMLRKYAPTGYEQTQRNEIIRDTCPSYGDAVRPDGEEDA
jgi:hypothetical protein